MSKDLYALMALFLSSMRNRKVWILIVFSLLTTLPVGFAIAISSTTPLQAVLLVRRWLTLIFLPLITLFFPLVLVMMIFADHITSGTIKELLVLPVSRKKVYLVGFLCFSGISLLFGLFLGILLYLSTSIGGILSFSLLPLSFQIIPTVGIVMATFSILYGGMYLSIAFMLNPDRSGVLLLFFFLLTFVWDLIFWRIGGNYAYLSYTYYKLKLFTVLLSHTLLGLQIRIILPLRTTMMFDGMVLGMLDVTMFLLALYRFQKKSF